jgi:hypothetical protein
VSQVSDVKTHQKQFQLLPVVDPLMVDQPGINLQPCIFYQDKWPNGHAAGG